MGKETGKTDDVLASASPRQKRVSYLSEEEDESAALVLGAVSERYNEKEEEKKKASVGVVAVPLDSAKVLKKAGQEASHRNEKAPPLQRKLSPTRGQLEDLQDQQQALRQRTSSRSSAIADEKIKESSRSSAARRSKRSGGSSGTLSSQTELDDSTLDTSRDDLPTPVPLLPGAVSVGSTAAATAAVDGDLESGLGYASSEFPVAIAAEAVPDQEDLEKEIADRLEKQMTQDLKSQVKTELQEEMKRAGVVVDAVPLSKDINDQEDPHGSKDVIACGIIWTKKRMLIAGILLLLIVVGVVVGVAIGASGGSKDSSSNGSSQEENRSSANPPNNGSSQSPADMPTATNVGTSDIPTATPSSSPSSSPSSPPTVDPIPIFLERYAEIAPPNETNWTVFESSSDSVQYQAMNFLAFDDPAALDFRTVDSKILVERYVAVLFLLQLNFIRVDPDSGKVVNKNYPILSAAPICQWNVLGEIGVFCNSMGSMERIDLANVGLSGSIPTEVGFFTNLNYIKLRRNNLRDSLPTELGRLTKLDYFGAIRNRFSNQIPSELGLLRNLTYLQLAENELTGPIPSELGECVSLDTLELDKNMLEDPLPQELSNLNNLVEITLEENLFRGSLDPAFCSPPNPLLEVFSADCFNQVVQCTCCTHCCGAGFPIDCVENN